MSTIISIKNDHHFPFTVPPKAPSNLLSALFIDPLRGAGRRFHRALRIDSDNSWLLRALMVIGIFTYGSHSVLTTLSKERGRVQYNVASVVLLTELAKLLLSCVMLVSSSGPKTAFAEALVSIDRRMFLLLSVPALLYAVNNNIAYYAQQLMDPASFMVLCNFKIITTAVLFRIVMNRKLSRNQWLSMPFLLASSMLNSMVGLSAHATSGSGALADTSRLFYVTPLGLALMVIYCIISGFAGVYSEYVLKSRMNVSIHLQNIPLYLCGILLNGLAFLVSSGPVHPDVRAGDSEGDASSSSTSGSGLLYAGPVALLSLVSSVVRNYNVWTWIIILTQAGNGLILSAVMKHSTNIAKLFMIALSMLLSTSISIVAFDMSLSWEFALSLILVLVALMLYHSSPAPSTSAAPSLLRSVSSVASHGASATSSAPLATRLSSSSSSSSSSSLSLNGRSGSAGSSSLRASKQT